MFTMVVVMLKTARGCHPINSDNIKHKKGCVSERVVALSFCEYVVREFRRVQAIKAKFIALMRVLFQGEMLPWHMYSCADSFKLFVGLLRE